MIIPASLAALNYATMYPIRALRPAIFTIAIFLGFLVLIIVLTPYPRRFRQYPGK